MSKATSATATAAAKPKGNPPSHRLSRISTKPDGTKDYEEVAALWPHKDSRGFSVKLKADLKAGDELMIRQANGGAP
jgi:hypothetical protein